MIKQFPAADAVVKKLEQAGFEAVFVGGAVRDYLLNKPQHDVDIATSALPNEVKEIFSKTVDVGIEHGTVLILDEGEPIEVTTYRTESTYSDYRRPDEVKFVRSLEEDLKRRDFTMNAMAIRSNGELVDLYGGQADIQAKQIKAVGEPVERFHEDALRMLRAVRFAAQLGFIIERNTLKAIQQECHSIQEIAKERIAAEMEKLFVSSYPSNGIKNLVDSGLSKYLVGDYSKHIDAFTTFQTKDSQIGWAYVAYLIGDPEKCAKFYKLSKKTRQFMQSVLEATNKLQTTWDIYDTYRFETVVIETAVNCLQWHGDRCLYTVIELLEQKQSLPVQSVQQLAASGHDLMKWAGGQRGPWLKEALHEMLMAVLTKRVQNETESLKEWFINDYFNHT